MLLEASYLVALLIALARTKLLEVDIVTFGHFGIPPNLASLYYHTAPMELAVEKLNSDLNGSIHFNIKFVYDYHHLGCGPYVEDITNMVAKWYYKECRPENVSLPVVVSPGMLSVTDVSMYSSESLLTDTIQLECGSADIVSYLCGTYDVFHMAT